MDNIFQKLCYLLTHHKYRHFIGWSVGIAPTEFHWQCKICGKRFWNHNKPTGFRDKK